MHRSTDELLRLNAAILKELKSRGVLRTQNNPTGDYAEYLFCKAFSWKQASNSVKGYDALDGIGTRFQIKARRLVPPNKSRQLSALRNLNQGLFDVLAGVLFDENYQIIRAAFIPHRLIEPNSRVSRHTNSHLFFLRDSVWDMDGVQDVTKSLKSAVVKASS